VKSEGAPHRSLRVGGYPVILLMQWLRTTNRTRPSSKQQQSSKSTSPP
jgi:hypothetical protein